MRQSEQPFKHRVPTFDELNWPALVALRELGGSASISEHLSKLVELKEVPDSIAGILHGDSGRTELEYRLAWARTWLRRCGYIENSARGVWSVTEAGEVATREALAKQISELRSQDQRKYASKNGMSDSSATGNDAVEDWQDTLLSVLRRMDPAAFERLAQRLLRESGFVQVEVTGRSGDGGIDGTGILRLSLMSFHVLFQCKRYQGSVGSGAVRDFRGAMMGRTDKGLIITTGTFSPDARREATRDGAPPIDLIDGVALCEKLKELQLGVSTKMVEEIAIRPEWFEQI
ncbi:restriction endonuclease [Sphingopyxis panaciterrulae]|uniref:Restriction system protein n=1 Tax=Sphingopyxis panaciterrulae TaxID=462372 RepID=A0A7W9B2H9_9SPHN|nr:restriction endonuclease [Sphingopyxis panaciterrulae]MBB5705024.1 restriction system protein [Sphingopyxis panaciterrulae]